FEHGDQARALGNRRDQTTGIAGGNRDAVDAAEGDNHGGVDRDAADDVDGGDRRQRDGQRLGDGERPNGVARFLLAIADPPGGHAIALVGGADRGGHRE